MQHRLLHGEVVVTHAVALVGHAHLDGVEGRKHIQLREGHIGEPVHLGSVTPDDGIEPAAAALAARGDAELMTGGAQKLAVLRVLTGAAVLGELQLRGEGALAHAGDIGLLDAEHAVDGLGADAGTRGSAARAAAGRRHERIGAMVDVEQRALSAFEKNGLPIAQRLVQHMGRLAHIGSQNARVRQVLVADLLHRVGVQTVNLLQDGVLLGQHRLKLQAEDLLVQQVLHADALAAHLVLVAGADAAFGGADLLVAEALLVGAIEILVVRHDKVRVVGNLQVLAGDALGLKHGHFLHEHARVYHDAVADDRHGVLVHDPGGHQVQRQLLVAVNDGVAGVIASLEAHHVIVVAGDEVGDLTLAFVAPLGADEHCAGHLQVLSTLGGECPENDIPQGLSIPAAQANASEWRASC